LVSNLYKRKQSFILDNGDLYCHNTPFLIKKLEEKLKNVIFEARILRSDWKDEFYDLSDEANSLEYNPCFKYTEEELIQKL
jgi:hypothetical protein